MDFYNLFCELLALDCGVVWPGVRRVCAQWMATADSCVTVWCSHIYGRHGYLGGSISFTTLDNWPAGVGKVSLSMHPKISL